MAILLFKDRGWEVATAAWSVAGRSGDKIDLCYQWGADHVSFFQSATGIAKITVNIPMEDFLKRVSMGGVVDLRSCQQ